MAAEVVGPVAAAREAIMPTDAHDQFAVSDDRIPQNTGATVREEAEDDGRHLLYEPEQELILLVNRSGRAILELCDGRHTVGAIVREIQSRYELKAEVDLHAEVVRYVRVLWATGLVRMVESRS